MRVVVTRPEREAQAWTAALSRHGFEVLALPLLVVDALADSSRLRDAWRRLAEFSAIMFVSAAAVDHFFACGARTGGPGAVGGATQPRSCWATGPGTTGALLRHGVEAGSIQAPAGDSAQFDSEALWRVVGPGVHAGDRILLVRGADDARDMARSFDAEAGHGRNWLAQQLGAAGARVEFLVAYRRRAPVMGPAQLSEARAAAQDGSVWLFTSSQALANLSTCVPGQYWACARAVATHARIAGAARALGFGFVRESRPGVADVVASIESIA